MKPDNPIGSAYLDDGYGRRRCMVSVKCARCGDSRNVRIAEAHISEAFMARLERTDEERQRQLIMLGDRIEELKRKRQQLLAIDAPAAVTELRKMKRILRKLLGIKAWGYE